MSPTLERIAGVGSFQGAPKLTASEDLSFYQEVVPALFFFLGVTAETDVDNAPANHSPLFAVDEGALIPGVRALAHLTADHMDFQETP